MAYVSEYYKVRFNQANFGLIAFDKFTVISTLQI